MWGDSKTTDSLNQLMDEVKSYVKLEKEYLTLDLVEKLSILFSAIILGFILMCLGIVVLFYLSFTLIYLISPLVGGLTSAYGIMTLLLLILAVVIYLKWKVWILNPITKFVAQVLLPTDTDTTEEAAPIDEPTNPKDEI